jgi:hypothetical protein
MNWLGHQVSVLEEKEYYLLEGDEPCGPTGGSLLVLGSSYITTELAASLPRQYWPGMWSHEALKRR